MSSSQLAMISSHATVIQHDVRLIDAFRILGVDQIECDVMVLMWLAHPASTGNKLHVQSTGGELIIWSSATHERCGWVWQICRGDCGT